MLPPETAHEGQGNMVSSCPLSQTEVGRNKQGGVWLHAFDPNTWGTEDL